MSFIKTAFENLWAHLTGLSTSVWNYVETYVLPVLKSEAGSLFIQLAPAALQAVIAAESKGGSNLDKFNYAFSQIKSAAVADGLTIGTSVLNTLVENALQQLKSQQSAGSAGSGAA